MTAQFAEVKDGSFVRQPNRFTDRITADGSSGFPVEAGRYVLYVCLACPWAHRSIVVRRLLGLEDAIELRVVDPIRDEQGWRFTLDEGGVDPVTGASYVMELYRRSDPDFDGRATVPFIWDTQTERIVTNDYPQITLDLSTEWTALHRDGAPELYPEHAREAIDDMAEQNFTAVNNGVYKAGFATSQESYEQAYDALFAQLAKLDEHLATERYLVGRTLTEADVRLYTTLVRFDAVYAIHFKCSLKRVVDYPNLWPYARDLYQWPGVRETVRFDEIRRHYYGTHPSINPSGLVALRPQADWEASPGRDRGRAARLRVRRGRRAGADGVLRGRAGAARARVGRARRSRARGGGRRELGDAVGLAAAGLAGRRHGGVDRRGALGRCAGRFRRRADPHRIAQRGCRGHRRRGRRVRRRVLPPHLGWRLNDGRRPLRLPRRRVFRHTARRAAVVPVRG